MTSQLELHLLSRLDEISAGVARLEQGFEDHLKAHADYDAAKKFNADVRRGRFRWIVTTLLAVPMALTVIWRLL